MPGKTYTIYREMRIVEFAEVEAPDGADAATLFRIAEDRGLWEFLETVEGTTKYTVSGDDPEED